MLADVPLPLKENCGIKSWNELFMVHLHSVALGGPWNYFLQLPHNDVSYFLKDHVTPSYLDPLSTSDYHDFRSYGGWNGKDAKGFWHKPRISRLNSSDMLEFEFDNNPRDNRAVLKLPPLDEDDQEIFFEARSVFFDFLSSEELPYWMHADPSVPITTRWSRSFTFLPSQSNRIRGMAESPTGPRKCFLVQQLFYTSDFRDPVGYDFMRGVTQSLMFDATVRSLAGRLLSSNTYDSASVAAPADRAQKKRPLRRCPDLAFHVRALQFSTTSVRVELANAFRKYISRQLSHLPTKSPLTVFIATEDFRSRAVQVFLLVLRSFPLVRTVLTSSDVQPIVSSVVTGINEDHWALSEKHVFGTRSLAVDLVFMSCSRRFLGSHTSTISNLAAEIRRTNYLPPAEFSFASEPLFSGASTLTTVGSVDIFKVFYMLKNPMQLPTPLSMAKFYERFGSILLETHDPGAKNINTKFNDYLLQNKNCILRGHSEGLPSKSWDILLSHFHPNDTQRCGDHSRQLGVCGVFSEPGVMFWNLREDLEQAIVGGVQNFTIPMSAIIATRVPSCFARALPMCGSTGFAMYLINLLATFRCDSQSLRENIAFQNRLFYSLEESSTSLIHLQEARGIMIRLSAALAGAWRGCARVGPAASGEADYVFQHLYRQFDRYREIAEIEGVLWWLPEIEFD